MAKAISIGLRSWAVGRREEEPGAPLPEDSLGLCALVAGQVIEDHHIALLERRRELGLDIGVEGLAVHGIVDHPGRGQAIAPQSGDEGLGRSSVRMVHRLSIGCHGENRPRRRVNLVVVPVSSRKISRWVTSRMRGWRCAFHSSRAWRTSSRSASEASRVFE